jgi:hypothetical protein
MKRVFVAAALLALVAAGVLLLVLSRADAIVEDAIERYGSQATDTPVRVDDVDLDLASGRGTVRGLTVANPEGFAARPAISFDEITLGLDLRSVRSDPVTIDLVRVGAPVVEVQVRADGRTNVDVLRRNLEASARAGEPGPPPAEPGDVAAEELGETRLRIRELEFTPGRARVDARELGREQPFEVELSPLTLREVGGDRGDTPEEIARTVAGALLTRTARAVAASQLKHELEKRGGELGRALGEALGEGLEGAGDALDQLRRGR